MLFQVQRRSSEGLMRILATKVEWRLFKTLKNRCLVDLGYRFDMRSKRKKELKKISAVSPMAGRS